MQAGDLVLCVSWLDFKRVLCTKLEAGELELSGAEFKHTKWLERKENPAYAAKENVLILR